MRMRRPTLASDPTGSWAGTMAEALEFAYTLMPVFLIGRADTECAGSGRSSG
jgi:hypothetical protein